MTPNAYAEYRRSDVPWISHIPAEWRTVPFFTVIREAKRPNLGMVESNLLSLSYGRIVSKDIGALGGLLPESFETYQVVHGGDLVFRFTDLQNDQRSLRTAMATERGIITSAYGVGSPVGIDPHYANYLMRAYDTTKVFYGFGGGVRQSIQLSDVARMPVLLPPMNEQRAIGDYLDRETAKIDALVAEQEGLVQVLRERRQAVIQRCVTRGRGAAPVVGTGIPWLGSIPRDWRVVRARHLMRIQTGFGDTVDAEPDGPYPFYVRSQVPLRSTDYDFEGPAVLTAGDGAGVAKVFHLVDGRFKAHQRVYVLNDFRQVLPRFFFYYFSTYFEKVALDGSAKSTVDSVRRWMIADMPVALPPIQEQQGLAEFLDAQTQRIDALIAEAEGIVLVAKERRSALVTAAVTGQIDVRGKVA